jgi:hypothetical protein
MKKNVLILLLLLIIPTVFASFPYSYTTKMILNLSFDEGAGTTVYDRHTGNTYDFTEANSNGWNTTVGFNGAYTYNGLVRYAYRNSGSTSMNLNAANFTFSAWIYPHSNDSSTGYIWHPRKEADMRLTVGSGTADFFSYDGSAGTCSLALGEKNKWHFIAITYDGTNKRVFIDNRTTTCGDGTPGAGGAYAHSIASDYGLATQFFNGTIDEVAVWNGSLSLSELQNNYNIGYNILNPVYSANTITASLYNEIDGTLLGNVNFYNVTGNLTFNYFNITNSGFCVQQTGNSTRINCTAGSGTNTFFNASTNKIITTDDTVTTTTYQAILRINATQLFTNNTIQSFNITNNLISNNTVSGEVIIKANGGSNNLMLNTTGNYTKNQTCNAENITTSYCTINNIYDSILTIGANNYGISISEFSINLSNNTLNANLYNTTIIGYIQVPLLRNYVYDITLTPSGLYSIENTSLLMDNQTKLYNFSVYISNTFYLNIFNETNNNKINNTNIELISNDYANNFTTTTGFLNVSLLVPGQYTIRYYVDNIVIRDYYTTLTNQSTQNLSLYLIDYDVSNYYVANIVDQSGIAVSNVTIKLLRYYVSCNCYKIVEMTITDTNGKGVLRVQPNIIPYKLIISKDGYSVTTEPTKFTEDTNTYTINLVGNPMESLENIDSVQRSLLYDNSTQTYTFTWTDSVNLVTQGCLVVDKFYMGTQTRVKNTCLSGATGSIIYTISDTNNTRYVATGLIDTNTEFSTYYEISEVSFVIDAINFGYAGLFIAFLLILIISIMGLESGGIDTMVIGSLVILLGLGAIGIIYTTWTMIVPIIILGIILIYKTRV